MKRQILFNEVDISKDSKDFAFSSIVTLRSCFTVPDFLRIFHNLVINVWKLMIMVFDLEVYANKAFVHMGYWQRISVGYLSSFLDIVHIGVKWLLRVYRTL